MKINECETIDMMVERYEQVLRIALRDIENVLDKKDNIESLVGTWEMLIKNL